MNTIASLSSVLTSGIKFSGILVKEVK